MSRLNRLSLRMRLTLLMALMLTVASVLLIASSIYAARTIYNQDFPAHKVEVSDDASRVPLVPRPPEAIVIERNNDFTAVGILSVVSVVAAGTVLTYLMAGRALKPVTKLSEEIEEIGEVNGMRPVRVPSSEDEVARLSRSFNRMISRLEKSFAAHKHFSANAAHELKTPLAAMIANIEVLELDDRPSPRQYKKTLEDTLHNAQRLSSLVNDLLKLNADQHVRMTETFAAKSMFDEIAEELGDQIRTLGIRFDNRVDGTLLHGDKSLLHRAFSNLVHNAVKYNKPGGTILVSAEDIGDSTRVILHDTGIGIPLDQVERIFEPFYCVDKSRSRELGGSGLGLAIVKMVIEKHGGDIGVDSAAGVSTTVRVRLPKPA